MDPGPLGPMENEKLADGNFVKVKLPFSQASKALPYRADRVRVLQRTDERQPPESIDEFTGLSTLQIHPSGAARERLNDRPSMSLYIPPPKLASSSSLLECPKDMTHGQHFVLKSDTHPHLHTQDGLLEPDHVEPCGE